MRYVLASACCLLALACGGVEDPGEAAPELSDSADEVAAIPTIVFYQGWGRSISGNLVQGGQARVRYEAGRLPDCRGEANGRPAWSITLFSRLADGPVVSRVIAGLAPDNSTPTGEVVLDLPSAGELQLWFQATNRWGCNAWDSSFGDNFRYTVERSATATLQFGADFSERLVGQLRAGRTVNIEYALSRLPNCRQGYNGFATWDILAYYRFDAGAAQYVPVTSVVDGTRLSVPTPIAIPAGARELELWFFASDRGGCRQYDSDYGRNYRFPL